MAVGDDYMTIASIYFRLNVNALVHEREVFQLMDVLGAIGGIKDLLMDIFLVMIGSYLTYNSTLVSVNQLNDA